MDFDLEILYWTTDTVAVEKSSTWILDSLLIVSLCHLQRWKKVAEGTILSQPLELFNKMQRSYLSLPSFKDQDMVVAM